MSANSVLADIFTRHQTHLQRLAGGQRLQLMPLLDDILKEIAAELVDVDIEQARIGQLNRIDTLIRSLMTETMSEMGDQFFSELDDIAVYESEFSAKALAQVSSGSIDIPSPELLASLITTERLQLVSGKKVTTGTPRQLWLTLSDAQTDMIAREVQTGISLGRSQTQIVASVRRLLKNRSDQQVGAVVRASVNHITTQARLKTFDANRDIIDGYKIVATLDGRTSTFCKGVDGKTYPDEVQRLPPYHYGCRTNVTAKINEKYALDLKGTRAAVDGPVDAKTTYNSWLKKQDSEFIEDTLGPSRAKLFESGGLHLDKFTDDAGRELNLAELRRREPLAFAKAGLE